MKLPLSPDRLAERPEHLLVQVGRGDRAAFTELYSHIATPVYSLALRIIGDPAQAEDVTQNTLLSVWRAAPNYDPANGKVLTWVLTVTHRRAVDWIRAQESQRGRERRLAQEDATRPAVDSTSEAVQRAADCGEVRDRLRALNPKLRDVLELMYFQGLTQAQAAQVLGVPLGTVKSRANLAYGQLREPLSATYAATV